MSVKLMKNMAAIALGATMLAGCASQGRDSFTVGSIPDDYRTTHPIIISEGEQALDIPVGSSTKSLNVPVISNIRAFGHVYSTSGAGHMTMMVPTGSANAHAVANVKQQIVDAIVEGGGQRHTIAVQHYDASQHGPSAPVRLTFVSVKASVGECGNWSGNLLDTGQNKHYADYGCSSQANMAAIIDNPGDLLGPRKMTPIDAAQRGAVYEAYSSGPNGGTSEVTY